VAKSISEQLDALFAPWNRTDQPGLVIGAALKGEIVYRRGFGMATLESFVANTPRTRMRLGSASKHFTCLLAMLLAEDGKLDLDTQIRGYISELGGPAGDPTLRQLMRHRGGSRCSLDLGFIGRGTAIPPVGTVLADLVRQKGRNFAPGEAMIYNNSGYHLLSIAIERVGGAPFEEQLKRRLFDPLGMLDTSSIPSDHAITPGMATLHTPSQNGWRRGLFPSEELRGEGGIVSTIDDMLRWTAHLSSRDRFGSAATWAALLEPPIGADCTVGQYGLGLRLSTYRDLRTIWHTGGVAGGASQMLLLPDQNLEVVILANGAPGANPLRLAEKIVDIILANQIGPAPTGLQAADYRMYLGDWWSEETGLIYSLIDDAGELKHNICFEPHPIPILRGGKGRLVSPSESFGDMAFDLDEPQSIAVSFAGRTARYRRVEVRDSNLAAFASAAVGRYFSDDANATATIIFDGIRLNLIMNNLFGQVESFLAPFCDTAASMHAISSGVIGLVREGGATTGFSLNTLSTRNLVFTRHPS
jgi:CubicO group peptidase (beta-lactamase class C family)